MIEGSIPLTSGSGSLWPKNMWIRNTGLETEELLRRQLIPWRGLAAELLARPLVPKQAHHHRLLLQTEM